MYGTVKFNVKMVVGRVIVCLEQHVKSPVVDIQVTERFLQVGRDGFTLFNTDVVASQVNCVTAIMPRHVSVVAVRASGDRHGYAMSAKYFSDRIDCFQNLWSEIVDDGRSRLCPAYLGNLV